MLRDETARAPVEYHQVLCPPVPEPGFHDPGELERVWGAEWGSHDEVGVLHDVLMRRPGDELAQIRAEAWDESAQALVDPDGGWYWTDRTPPDLDRVRAQHGGLVAALEADGVSVHFADPLPARFTKAIYTRDPLASVPGGVVIGRMAPLMRRGEEASVTRAVAALGIPILQTIVGTGMFEGGTFVKLTPKVAAFGTSIRCNAEAADQLRELLARLGIELIVVPMGGFSIHIDAHLGMVDVDKALVDAPGLPHWFLDRLAELGIEPIWCHPGEEWGINCLTVRPGRVIMPDDSPRTAELLDRRGIEVVPIPYDELHKNGGGIHCSTMELRRSLAA
jgi:N-dimethylarginine dimethylaminohydrolase